MASETSLSAFDHSSSDHFVLEKCDDLIFKNRVNNIGLWRRSRYKWRRPSLAENTHETTKAKIYRGKKRNSLWITRVTHGRDSVLATKPESDLNRPQNMEVVGSGSGSICEHSINLASYHILLHLLRRLSCFDSILTIARVCRSSFVMFSRVIRMTVYGFGTIMFCFSLTYTDKCPHTASKSHLKLNHVFNIA